MKTLEEIKAESDLNAQDSWIEWLAKEGVREWFETRPANIQEAVKKHPGTWLYRLNETQLVTIHSYYENDEGEVDLKVEVLRKYNPAVTHERLVFGIKPSDLTPVCIDLLLEKYLDDLIFHVHGYKPQDVPLLSALAHGFESAVEYLVENGYKLRDAMDLVGAFYTSREKENG